MATSSCPSSSTSTCEPTGSSADKRQQRRPDDAQQGLCPGVLSGQPTGQLPLNSARLTQLRQRHPDDAQQFQGLASLFAKPVCVGIIA
jgi:hypothetical protein